MLEILDIVLILLLYVFLIFIFVYKNKMKKKNEKFHQAFEKSSEEIRALKEEQNMILKEIALNLKNLK